MFTLSVKKPQGAISKTISIYKLALVSAMFFGKSLKSHMAPILNNVLEGRTWGARQYIIFGKSVTKKMYWRAPPPRSPLSTLFTSGYGHIIMGV